MKAVCLDGRVRNWNFSGCRTLGDETRPRSKLHVRARGLIRKVFGGTQLLEEVPIPGTRLRCDFLMPSLSVMVEVQGRQHYEPSAHLHGSTGGFHKSLKRDRDKVVFCQQNEIRLVLLKYDGTDDAWEQSLREG